MKEITVKDYRKFIKTHNKIVIEDRIGKKEISITIGQPHRIKPLHPKDFVKEAFTCENYRP